MQTGRQKTDTEEKDNKQDKTLRNISLKRRQANRHTEDNCRTLQVYARIVTDARTQALPFFLPSREDRELTQRTFLSFKEGCHHAGITEAQEATNAHDRHAGRLNE
mmetsp:Transcript_39006/g.76699  ORF Transcript_39006/g.76699 Transcript_39006/m.76699 type:complete len:106 (-) Transcript_39006:4655-4972(-)